MAEEESGSSCCSTTEDTVCAEESADYRLMFKCFKENKVEIASAITKSFPFLMSLRDRDFISEQKFQISKKKCENQDAVRNVVYDILCDLQKNFSLRLLEVIFSPTHLKAYPDLKEILSIFLDEQSTSENEMCSCVMCYPAHKPKDREARIGSSQADTMETGNNTTVGKSKGKRRKKKCHNRSIAKQRKPQTSWVKNNSRTGGQAAVRRRKAKKNPEGSAKTVRCRGRRRRRKHNADFSAALLPVTCGDAKGMLHKDKFKQGTSVKSIQSEDGDWFSPHEFEILGGHERSKNWKLSLRCYNWPLKLLIRRKFLPNSPRIYGKRKKGSRRRCGPD